MTKVLNFDSDTVLAKLKAGDDVLFNQLIQQHHSLLLRIARQYVSRENAEEVVQEAWISAYRGIKNFAGRSSIKTWLVRVCINAAKNRIRHDSTRRSTQEITSIEETYHFLADGHFANSLPAWHDESPEAILKSEQLCRLLVDTINVLPETQKSVLILHDIEGIKLAEICNILNVSTSNIRVLLHRARMKLRDVINDYQVKSEYAQV